MLTVLEVGGTHVTAALVDDDGPTILEQERMSIDSAASAGVLLDAFVGAVQRVGTPSSRLVVAIPGPFDYERGIGDFDGVAKFGSLKGVHIGDELATRLDSEVLFVNDVTAYAIGQYVIFGRPRRLVTLTLGTGVGSAFLDDGTPVEQGPLVPPHGWVYLLKHDGKPLEESFSRRAIIAAYTTAAERELDVAEIAALAIDGDPAAAEVMRRAYGILAEAIASWLVGFDTSTLVVGGSISGSWDLVERWFSPSVIEHFDAAGAPPPRIEHGEDGEAAAITGAALHARRLMDDA